MTVIITIIEDSYQDVLNIVIAEDVPNVFHVDINFFFFVNSF